jgi:zinc protease
MGYEADRMAGLSFDEAVVAPERDVVLEERRMRVDADPASQLMEEMSGALYLHHPYGTPIIGWEHEIAGLSHADAFAYYRRFYTPENAILVVAGDTDAEEVRRLAEASYGAVAARGARPERVRPAEPPARARRVVEVRDARVRQPLLYRSFLAPNYLKSSDMEAHALDVALEILAGGPTSRLYRALVAERQLASHAGGSYFGSMLDSGRISFSIAPAEGVSLDTVETALGEVVDAYLQSGPTASELARAQTRLVADTIYSRDSQSTLARVYGASLAIGETMEDVAAWPERIEAVTNEMTIAALGRHVDLTRGVTGRLTGA